MLCNRLRKQFSTKLSFLESIRIRYIIEFNLISFNRASLPNNDFIGAIIITFVSSFYRFSHSSSFHLSTLQAEPSRCHQNEMAISLKFASALLNHSENVIHSFSLASIAI